MYISQEVPQTVHIPHYFTLLLQMCFKDALFPLLARMRRGLYYNSYLYPGCVNSGLMQAFSKHLLARLGIHQEPSDPERVRVTLLSRSTKHRRILNEDMVCEGGEGVGLMKLLYA